MCQCFLWILSSYLFLSPAFLPAQTKVSLPLQSFSSCKGPITKSSPSVNEFEVIRKKNKKRKKENKLKTMSTNIFKNSLTLFAFQLIPLSYNRERFWGKSLRGSGRRRRAAGSAPRRAAAAPGGPGQHRARCCWARRGSKAKTDTICRSLLLLHPPPCSSPLLLADCPNNSSGDAS